MNKLCPSRDLVIIQSKLINSSGTPCHLLYKQRRSWNTVYNARKATCNLPQANATCNL